MAAAWAVLHHVGDDGYLRLGGGPSRHGGAGQRHPWHPALVLRAEPDAMLLAFGAADPDQLDVFASPTRFWAKAGTSIARAHHRRSIAPSTRSTRDGSKNSWATSTMPCRGGHRRRPRRAPTAPWSDTLPASPRSRR